MSHFVQSILHTLLCCTTSTCGGIWRIVWDVTSPFPNQNLELHRLALPITQKYFHSRNTHWVKGGGDERPTIKIITIHESKFYFVEIIQSQKQIKENPPCIALFPCHTQYRAISYPIVSYRIRIRALWQTKYDESNPEVSTYRRIGLVVSKGRVAGLCNYDEWWIWVWRAGLDRVV